MKPSKLIKTLKIATRKSMLALWQANFVKTQLLNFYPELDVQILAMTTSGDKHLETPLFKMGGKGLFVKELEESLFSNEADIAVHSMKDVPAHLPEGLVISTILAREDPREAWVSNLYPDFTTLPPNSIVGTSSLRRQAQLLKMRPDITCLPLRGNVDTRLKKLDNQEYDALVLAAAGLKRLGFNNRIAGFFEETEILPAVGQGALGLECKVENQAIQDLIAVLHDEETAVCVEAERAMNQALGGNCAVPIAGFAKLLPQNQLELTGRVLSPEARDCIETRAVGARTEYLYLGQKVAQNLLNLGARNILDKLDPRLLSDNEPGLSN